MIERKGKVKLEIKVKKEGNCGRDLEGIGRKVEIGGEEIYWKGN